VLAYQRRAGDDLRQVWANFGGEPVRCPSGWAVDVATARHQDGVLAGGEAVVLRPPG
jgi:hypothetical protein